MGPVWCEGGDLGGKDNDLDGKRRECVDGAMRSQRCAALRCRDAANPLLPYAIGIRLYFFSLKALARLFFWLSLGSVFTMACFWRGSAWDVSAKRSLIFGAPGRGGSKKNAATSSASSSSSEPGLGLGDESDAEGGAGFTSRLTNALFFVSLGSWGENVRVCDSAEDGTELTLSCPFGTMTSLHASYGDPHGSCFCPAEQQLDPTGQCPQEVIFYGGESYGSDEDDDDNDSSEGGSDDSESGSARTFAGCAARFEDSQLEEEGYCLAGKTLFGDSCCARSLNGHAPDLRLLTPRDNPSCRSFTAQHIVQSLCLGKASCNVTVDSSRSYAYTTRNFRGEHLSCFPGGDWYNFSSSYICRDSFGAVGNWSGCPRDDNFILGRNTTTTTDSSEFLAPRRLVVFAQCTNDAFTFPRSFSGASSDDSWGLRKPDAARLLAIIDAVMMVLVLAFLSWLQQKEDAEVEESNLGLCTASDFSVVTHDIPPHEDIASLRREMGKFLGAAISKCPPVTRTGPCEVCEIHFGLNNVGFYFLFNRSRSYESMLMNDGPIRL